MRQGKRIAGLAMGMLVSWLAPSWAQSAFYTKIIGTKQGAFKGEGAQPMWKDWLPGLAYRYEIGTPTAANGLATGQAQHSLITITKRWGAASPQILTALATNEVLKSVEVRFVRGTGGAAETVYCVITLKNATIRHWSQHYEPPVPGVPGGNELLEDVSFACETVQVTDPIAKTETVVDWKLGPAAQPALLRGTGLVAPAPR